MPGVALVPNCSGTDFIEILRFIILRRNAGIGL
jgi:hypothetical protein